MMGEAVMHMVEAILSFDGTDVDDLKAVAASDEAADTQTLVSLCGSDVARHRVAATWLVKALLERGAAIGLDLERVFVRIETETAWEALLHLLQSVRFDPATAVAQRDAIRRHLDHDRAFVRVWALDAFVQVALAEGAELEEARARVDEALTARQASLRARARQLAPLVGL